MWGNMDCSSSGTPKEDPIKASAQFYIELCGGGLHVSLEGKALLASKGFRAEGLGSAFCLRS